MAAVGGKNAVKPTVQGFLPIHAVVGQGPVLLAECLGMKLLFSPSLNFPFFPLSSPLPVSGLIFISVFQKMTQNDSQVFMS